MNTEKYRVQIIFEQKNTENNCYENMNFAYGYFFESFDELKKEEFYESLKSILSDASTYTEEKGFPDKTIKFFEKVLKDPAHL